MNKSCFGSYFCNTYTAAVLIYETQSRRIDRCDKISSQVITSRSLPCCAFSDSRSSMVTLHSTEIDMSHLERDDNEKPTKGPLWRIPLSPMPVTYKPHMFQSLMSTKCVFHPRCLTSRCFNKHRAITSNLYCLYVFKRKRTPFITLS